MTMYHMAPAPEDGMHRIDGDGECVCEPQVVVVPWCYGMNVAGVRRVVKHQPLTEECL